MLQRPSSSAGLEGVLGVQCQEETRPPPPLKSERGEDGKELAEDNRRGESVHIAGRELVEDGAMRGGRGWKGGERRSRTWFVDSLVHTSQAGRD